MCFTERAGEQGWQQSGVERRVVSDAAMMVMAGGGVYAQDRSGKRECWRRVSRQLAAAG